MTINSVAQNKKTKKNDKMSASSSIRRKEKRERMTISKLMIETVARLTAVHGLAKTFCRSAFSQFSTFSQEIERKLRYA